jgi:N-acetylglutamate synthase-like GNAT family acetyltransferase
MMRRCGLADFDAMYEIINDAASAYKGVIPDDRWHDPYLSRDHLGTEIEDGVEFWGFEADGKLAGVMGIQDRGEVVLIRHAYVATKHRRKGIGSGLLRELLAKTRKPVLIGTWAAARWAVDFYRKHGFCEVSDREKDMLLKRYWRIPDRQVETSVVMADESYRKGASAPVTG